MAENVNMLTESSVPRRLMPRSSLSVIGLSSISPISLVFVPVLASSSRKLKLPIARWLKSLLVKQS